MRREAPQGAEPGVTLGVTGSIAAYKGLELVRRLRQSGVLVRVVMTREAKRFVGPLSFATLSEHPVCEPFRVEDPLVHLSLTEEGGILAVVPATANILGKAAAGIGDDLLTTLCLSSKGPVIFAPAMDEGMWQNPVVQRNIRVLKDLGHLVIEPEEGELASGRIGKGRLASLDRIYEEIMAWRTRVQDFAEVRAIVSLGRIEEPLDPVRVITNKSSGRMGIDLARALRQRGAEVVLVSGQTDLEPIPGAEYYRVGSAQELSEVLTRLLPNSDLLFMVAAVADYRPTRVSSSKLKGARFSVEFTRTEDILAGLKETRPRPIMVGFSVETHDPISEARRKLKAKGLDLIVANPVWAIGSDHTQATLLFRDERVLELPKLPKSATAHRILDEVKGLRRGA